MRVKQPEFGVSGPVFIGGVAYYDCGYGVQVVFHSSNKEEHRNNRYPWFDDNVVEAAKERADLICKAVNNHGELLEALQNVSPLLDGLINRTETGTKRNELCDLNIIVKAAIKKATE